MEEVYGWSVVVASLDDLYLTGSERVALAEEVHPLLATRGVPGTHDVGLGIDFVEACMRGDWAEAECPLFDKARDERVEKGAWLRLEQTPDLVLFEGWCMGAVAEPVEALGVPVNDLERVRDAEGVWRWFVNERLGEEYQRFFDLFSYWIFLRPASFEAVVENRLKQEKRLRERGGGNAIMADEQVRDFVALFERLTRWMWREFPARADVVVELAAGHEIDRMVVR
jgi:D-glycerate 3-kinase